MTRPPDLPLASQRTVASYEGFAEEYSKLGDPFPPPEVESGLKRLAEAAVNGIILEIGSGPGWEADALERLGAKVRRTDAAEAFLTLQRRRGKTASRLNVISDPLGGPYSGIAALCVLIHVGRDLIDVVLAKIHAALRPGGAFLVSLREGDGETLGAYHTIYWQQEEFSDRLTRSRFVVEDAERSLDCDGDAWITFFARTPL